MLKKIFRKVKKSQKVDFTSNEHADFSKEELDIISAVSKFTMTSPERLVTLIRSVIYLENNGIKGDFIECGVWKGGSVMAMIKVLQSIEVKDREIWLFDTFQGMTEPIDFDSKFDDTKAAKLLLDDSSKKSNVWAVSSLDEVSSNIASLNYPSKNLKFVQGPVEETLLTTEIDEIALLRLDTDWYESTKIELEILFPKLVKGGILIIDDYGHWKGCKKAVDEYFQKLDYPIFLNRIDYTGRTFVKYW
ncbi:TylF/MycF/NovP-related O-methyltransferase [Algoriphagus sp. PAP.12]|uniref:TylF/MycF/NovP-related O-methyltransferase n=1 Tax=Algoriphagus sp. PAP.12 TaxID=2996678 RepID=UPI00227CEFC7|nr:TylF/MycF/NovP-related O-methyltransferase [Algoriphagus sp. PAP.12]